MDNQTYRLVPGHGGAEATNDGGQTASVWLDAFDAEEQVRPAEVVHSFRQRLDAYGARRGPGFNLEELLVPIHSVHTRQS